MLWWRRDAAGRALDGAIGALDRGEEHWRVVERVRRLELRGRSRMCRDTALRCLVEAGRCRRLDRRLRGEAGRWLREARDGHIAGERHTTVNVPGPDGRGSLPCER